MAKKADAWNEYKDAAMVDMILQQLPKVGKFLKPEVIIFRPLDINYYDISFNSTYLN